MITPPLRLLLFACCLLADAARAGDVERLLASLDATRDVHDVPAYGLALVDGQRTVWAGARGVADLESGRRADGQTVFRIGSVTKLFTALAIVRAVEDGVVGLGQPVAELIGDGLIDNAYAARAPVLLVHLLEHTAGLAELSTEEMYHSDPTPMTLADAVRFRPANRRVLWPPGLHYSYTNAGTGLASYALERTSGIPFEDYLQRAVLDPLEMRSASLRLDQRTGAALAVGYDTDRRTPIPYWHMLFRAFGGLNATPADMAAVLKLLLGNGEYAGRRVVGAAHVARMEYPETTLAARSGLRFGYGLGLYAWYHRGVLFLGHGGDGDGYLAHLGYSRARNQGYFLVINAFTHGPLREMRTLVENYIVGETDSQAAETSPPGSTAAAVAGVYERATHRFPPAPGEPVERMRIISDGDILYTRDQAGSRSALLPLSAVHYRRPGEPAATIAIVPGPNGRLVYQGERENFVRIESGIVGQSGIAE